MCDQEKYYEYQIRADLKSVSKAKIQEWMNKAIENKAYFNAAIKIGLSNEKPVSWRCSWIIYKVTEKDPTRIIPFVDLIIDSLGSLKYESQIAGFLKTLISVKDFKEDQYSIIADYCIKIIYDTQLPSHNKYYAIQLLLKTARKYPELSREFALVIETNLPYFTKPYLKKYSREVIAQLC